MFKNFAMDMECKASNDYDTCLMPMKDYEELENSRVNYQNRNHMMKWLNYVEATLKTTSRTFAGTYMQEVLSSVFS